MSRIRQLAEFDFYNKSQTDSNIVSLSPPTDLTPYYNITQVDAQISSGIGGVIDGAPATLDTLREIALSIGNDNDLVGSMTTLLDGKVDDSQVLTNVPSGALFTDTVYTHPTNHAISVVTGLQSALDGKVDDSQVLTNVPSGALFTDTETTTTLSVAANVLKYTDEVGGITNLDLSLYLDDTNLAYVQAGTLNGTTGIATFTRSDATTFTVDLSALLDDTSVTVNNTLTSISTTEALSANQGKVLKGLADGLETRVALNDAKVSNVDHPLVQTAVPVGALFTDNNTTYSVGDGGLTQKNFTSADHSKLNGIEAGATADQTGAQILALFSNSITAGHIAANAIGTSELGADAVTSAQLANNAINSEHYADGSIDRAHLAADVIDSTKLANDSVNSEHYVNGSVDDAHISGMAASKLTGTIADARFPSTLPAISGANLTGIETVTKSATAPSSPAAGDMWFNSSASTVSSIASKCMASYSGTEWIQMSNKFSATGGTESTYSSGGVNYKVHTFTSSGTFNAEASGPVDVLVVAGGGAGGTNGGGGGAGGYRLVTNNSVSSGNNTVTIGAGGVGKPYSCALGNSGNNSVFNGITSNGGGVGGSCTTGTSGGSGGGGGYTGTNVAVAGGSGTSGQGNNGGIGNSTTAGYGGGGGAGAVGQGGTGANDGGDGLANSYRTGSNITYAGGGGGGRQSGSPAGAGGAGGGGAGATMDGTGSNGVANTGGGAGGCGGGGGTSGNGGSGIIVIRYAV